MDSNFAKALPRVLAHEGGYVNHPDDPGGATNKGITWRTYNAWRERQGLPRQDVRLITDDEVAAIYRVQYWDAVRGDDLPSGVDYAVFDFAVNSGPARAAQFLQRVVGVTADGAVGQLTLQAVERRDPAEIVKKLCAARLEWLKRLATWPTFGRGWERRVREVEAAGVQMAVQHNPGPLPARDAIGKADGDERMTASLAAAAADPAALAAAGSLVTATGTLAQGGGPVQWALAAVLVMAGLVAVVAMVRKIRVQ